LDQVLDFILRNPPDIAGFLMLAVAFIIALSLHEYGHAFAATLQGDPTAKLAGRLTINPIKHLDPVGTFMLVMVGFGWGKPVPFAPNKLRSKRFGAAMVGIAGPVVNIILAFLAAFIYLRLNQARPPGLLAKFIVTSLYLNVGLALFNLMPIPPLDGSRILSAVLPPDKQEILYFLDKWGFVILLLFAFLLFPAFARPLIDSVVRFIITVLA
jgi:Zn-dependent protease